MFLDNHGRKRPLKTRAGLLNQDDPFDVKLVKMQLFDAQRDAAVVCTTPAAPWRK